jgi:hypothetical protein
MLRYFSAGWLSNIYQEALDAEHLTAGYISGHADVVSYQPVHFALDADDYAPPPTWLENNSTIPAAAPVAPTPAQVSPVPANNVASIEAPSTMASSNNTSSSGRYETTGSITVRNFHKQLDLYDGSTRLILAVDEHDNIIALLPAPQVSHHNAHDAICKLPRC